MEFLLVRSKICMENGNRIGREIILKAKVKKSYFSFGIRKFVLPMMPMHIYIYL